MHVLFLLSAPMAALAVPMAVTPGYLPVQPRDAPPKIPFLVEDASCRQSYDFTSDTKYAKMLTAVKHARDMAQLAIQEWWEEGKHGEAAATYLAIPDDGNYKENEFAQMVHANLQNVAALDEAVPLIGHKVQVFCTDKYNKCDKRIEGSNKPVVGYVEEGTSDVVLCPMFFNSDHPDLIRDMWKSGTDLETVTMDYLTNSASNVLHEFMHLNDISNPRPHITDKMVDGHRAYTAPTIADWVLNRKEKTSEVIQNADSYAQFVNAVYFTKEFGFLPKPEKEALVEQVDCWGEEDQYIDKNQDKHIADFCNKVTDEYEPGSFGEIIHEYDEGTPDHVRFRLFRRLGRLPSEDVNAQCLDALPKIFHHNCDTDSQWKHGGSVTYNKGDEAAYTWYMEPRHARPLPIPAKASAKCEVWWKATHVEFFISGGLWAGDDYGQSQLLPNLRGCGDVTAWTFDYNEEPKEDGREWEAYGRLPYWGDQWGCVRQAMIDAGADGDFGCGGK